MTRNTPPPVSMGDRLHTDYQWTRRQRQVLDLIVRGKSNTEIARVLDISLAGAKWHVSEILSKLQVTSREEAAEYLRHYNGLAPRFARIFRGGLAFGGAAKIALAAGAIAAIAAVSVAALLALRSSGEPPSAPASSLENPSATTTVSSAASTTPSIEDPSATTTVSSAASTTPTTPTATRTLRLDPDHGPCTTAVTATADGFPPDALVELRQVGMIESPVVATATSDASGRVRFVPMQLPEGCIPGIEPVYEASEAGQPLGTEQPRAVFTVDQIGRFTVSPASGACGPVLITVSGAGLPPSIVLRLADGSADPFAHVFAELGEVSTSPAGDFSTTVQLRVPCGPGTAVGIYGYDKNGTVEARWKAVYTVAANPSTTPVPAP